LREAPDNPVPHAVRGNFGFFTLTEGTKFFLRVGRNWSKSYHARYFLSGKKTPYARKEGIA
jgi:hypothetical protein